MKSVFRDEGKELFWMVGWMGLEVVDSAAG